MTPEKIVLYEVKEAISQLSEDDRIRVEAIAMNLRNILTAGGEHASMALALIGAEEAAK